MSLDTFTLQAIVGESASLIGSKIVAVEQYGSTEMGFVLRNSEGRRALAISVQPNYGRIYMTDPARKSAASSALLNALREHLLAGALDAVETVPNERIVILRCSGRTPAGIRPYRIVAELIDRHTMLVFMHESDLTIIETLRRVRTGDRDPSPGERYEPPESPEKIPVVQAVPDFIADAGTVDNTKQLVRFLTKQFGGLSPAMAREVIAGADLAHIGSLTEEERRRRLWASLSFMRDRVVAKAWSPCIGMDETDQPVILSALPILSLPPERVVAFDTMNEAIVHFYEAQIEQEQRKQREGLVRRLLAEEVRRLERLVENLWRDVAVAEQEGTFRKYGELLTANLTALKFGQSEAVVRDYYDPDQGMISIELNPNASPSDNADRYFKRARKAREGRAVIEKRLLESEERLEKVRKALESIPDQATSEQVERAYRACIRLDLIKEKRGDRQKRVKKKKGGEIHPRRFVTTDGSLVMVGRNNRENEVLTKTASPDDIWLHARDMGGSHVILKREGKKAMPSKTTCYEAACVAAYFSKGRGSTTVPVDYTERRYVRKQKDGGPGQVIFTHEKTLFVAPKLELKEQDDQGGDQGSGGREPPL